MKQTKTQPTIYSTKKTFFAKFMHIFGITVAIVLFGLVLVFMYCDIRSWLPDRKSTYCKNISGN